MKRGGNVSSYTSETKVPFVQSCAVWCSVYCLCARESNASLSSYDGWALPNKELNSTRVPYVYAIYCSL